MKTVRDACKLQPNALTIKLSDQIEQLDDLISAEGDGAVFFEKTHITQGMQDLISEGIARLAGASSQAVFHLKQAMGGGKTHLLVGFGLLAKHPELRKTHCAGLPNASSFKSAIIGAFNGRNNPDNFFWGEIANQLGKGDQFKAFWTSGPKAPDEKDWIKLFEGDQPVLILLDEMPPYFHYLDTQKVGNGTVADIATRAFANLLTAAGKKNNVCVVISDLSAAYDTGGRLINRALQDARAELGRQERSITPVDLAANEIYDILRKRLFKSLPDEAEIGDIAEAFGRKLEEAAKSKTANRGAEAISDEISATYPFHPRLKNIIALFKENEQFKQTRGLIELVSRLLRSVWDRNANDIFLIGPQHFDLSIQEIRDKLTEFSGMRDVIAKDLWDAQRSAHAQIIDLQTGKEAATQIGALLLSASLSTAVNAVKGLTREEMVECLVSPLREPSEFLAAFEELEKVAWYVHHTPEGRYYFDRQENLTKLLQSLAHDAPENQIDELIRHRLKEMFKPTRKTCYEDILPLPKLEDVADRVRKGRVLLVISPDSKIPPEEVQKFFEGLSQKNNLCVLTGDKTDMGSVEKATRQLFAAQKADGRIPQGHPQREDLERKQQTYEQDFNSTILGLFDKVLFPIQRAGKQQRFLRNADRLRWLARLRGQLCGRGHVFAGEILRMQLDVRVPKGNPHAVAVGLARLDGRIDEPEQPVVGQRHGPPADARPLRHHATGEPLGAFHRFRIRILPGIGHRSLGVEQLHLQDTDHRRLADHVDPDFQIAGPRLGSGAIDRKLAGPLLGDREDRLLRQADRLDGEGGVAGADAELVEADIPLTLGSGFERDRIDAKLRTGPAGGIREQIGQQDSVERIARPRQRPLSQHRQVVIPLRTV